MSQCKAKSKRTGQRCGAKAVTGRDVCYHHGGKTPRGIASPQTTHGRYSKHLPTRLAALYQEAQNDDELLNLRDDIALVETRLKELVGRVEAGDAGTAWQGVQNSYRALRVGMQRKDTVMIQQSLTDLDGFIEKGMAERGLWQEITGLLDQRRRLTESERKRLIEAQQTITAERAMLLVGAIVGIIKANVTDRATLAKISADIERLVTA